MDDPEAAFIGGNDQETSSSQEEIEKEDIVSKRYRECLTEEPKMRQHQRSKAERIFYNFSFFLKVERATRLMLSVSLSSLPLRQLSHREEGKSLERRRMRFMKFLRK
jgi:hypothetical protein